MSGNDAYTNAETRDIQHNMYKGGLPSAGALASFVDTGGGGTGGTKRRKRGQTSFPCIVTGLSSGSVSQPPTLFLVRPQKA